MIHTIERNGRYTVLDVESGAIFDVDQIAYEVAKIWSEEGRDALPGDLLDRFDEGDVVTAISEFDELKENGHFDTARHEFVPMGDKNVIKSMCLHVAHDCNLRCDYCFAGKGEYQSGKALMPLSVGKKALEFLMKNSGYRTNLEVDFFGGEPLINLGVVKNLVAYGRKLEKEYNKKIAFTMTTNCLAVNDDVIEFCNKEISNVVISIDGRKEVHNAVRRTVSGQDSYDLVKPRAQKLGISRQELGKEYYARATFTRRNLDFSKDVLALHEMGFDQISVEPVVLPEGDDLAIREEDLATVFDQYDKLADIIEEHEANGDWFNFFHFMLDGDEGPCLSKRMSGCGAGNEYIAVTPQGDIFPCHQFVGNKEFSMGNVLTGEYSHTMRNRFAGNNIVNKEDCVNCWAKYFCSGGCAANAHNFTGSIDKPYEIACKMQKKRLEVALDLFSRDKSVE